MLKASCWAGNVGELAKLSSPISSLLFPSFTPLPYYRVYRSAFMPIGPPTHHTLQAHGHKLEGRMGEVGVRGKEKENKHKEKQVTPHQCRELNTADSDCMCFYLATYRVRRSTGGVVHALELKWHEVMRWIVLSDWREVEKSPLNTHSHKRAHSCHLPALETCFSSTQAPSYIKLRVSSD